MNPKEQRIKQVLEERDLEMANITQMPWAPKEGQFAADLDEPKFQGKGSVYRLPAHLRKELSAPFPSEAMHQYQGKGAKLTSIKAMWIFERLNSVFGMMGWTVDKRIVGIFDEPVREEVWVKNDDGSLKLNQWGKPIPDKINRTGNVLYTFRVVVIEARIYIRQFDLYTPFHYGWAAMDDYPDSIGDAFKKALTDAITKVAGNFLEVGVQVFKGMQESQVANVISRFTAEEEERYKREYLRSVYGDPEYPEELAKSEQHPEANKVIQQVQETKNKAVEQVDKPESPASESKSEQPKEAPSPGSVVDGIAEVYGDVESFAQHIERQNNAQAIKEVLAKAGIDADAIDMAEFETLTGAKKRTKNTVAAYIRVKFADTTTAQEQPVPADQPPAHAPEEPQPTAQAQAPAREPLIEEEDDDEEDELPFGPSSSDDGIGDVDPLDTYKEACREFRSAQDFKENYKEIYAAAKGDDSLSEDDLKNLQAFMTDYLKSLKAK